MRFLPKEMDSMQVKNFPYLLVFIYKYIGMEVIFQKLLPNFQKLPFKSKIPNIQMLHTPTENFKISNLDLPFKSN
jgi:hypothetical protein